MSAIEKLLKSLQSLPEMSKRLLNNLDTWGRIARKDGSLESELGTDIASWIAENPYSDMSTN